MFVVFFDTDHITGSEKCRKAMVSEKLQMRTVE